jgi:Protein phosphatase 2C
MNWRVIGASVIGTSHLASGSACQDAHLYRVLPAGELVVAVADGAGSAVRSGEGSALAVERAIASITTSLSAASDACESWWRKLMACCFADAREAIVQLAEGDASPLRLFATTLIVAVVTPECLITGQVGDGLAVVGDATGELVLVARPQRGEYANEACFITMPQAGDLLDVQVHNLATHSLAISTDGLLRLALRLPGYEPHAPFFKPLFDFVAGADDEALAGRQLADFLQSPRVCNRTDDDKTLVLAARG